MAFDSLTEKLQNVFKNLRSKGRLTEADVKDSDEGDQDGHFSLRTLTLK